MRLFVGSLLTKCPEALRLSMLAVMNGPERPHFAHPMFWAPFVVVGEGGSAVSSIVDVAPSQPPKAPEPSAAVTTIEKAPIPTEEVHDPDK